MFMAYFRFLPLFVHYLYQCENFNKLEKVYKEKSIVYGIGANVIINSVNCVKCQ